MQFPRILRTLLEEFRSGPNNHGAGGLDHLMPLADAEMTQILSLAAIQKAPWVNETNTVAVWRAFLSTLPASVLENPEVRCKEAVRERLRHLLGEEPDAEDLQLVVSVVKRLQRYQRGGRSEIGSTPFDPEYASHRAILIAQSWRCKCCGYMFKPTDLFRDFAEDLADGAEEPTGSACGNETIDSPFGPFDRSPPKIRRQAQLDHVFPVYLAGDNENNWQVLCRCCNAGKSDLVLGFENRAWFGRARLEDLVGTTTRVFYMVIRRDGKCSVCGRGPSQVELRIGRRDPNGADLYTNLVTRCIECVQLSASGSSSAANGQQNQSAVL
jgi:5-methylcytosine-specific restriction endonuclease McrA